MKRHAVFFKTYSEASGRNVSDFSTYQRNNNNNYSTEASFNALTDRGISLETVKKYGVKSILSSDGSVYEHHYPMYINNEVVANKQKVIKATSNLFIILFLLNYNN